MDYDDNDFQSQNLHLASENNNKYPPVLQPYALPKFDFDDSLNSHLRFDSLGESEAFLGIEGNEHNNWIEDFSRGSSGVVFSSSAAESCAISRHNNVWSEATSMESVEMLLKSVGQDEIIAGEDTVKKSDTCDELGCAMELMEPSETRGEKNLSKEEAGNLQPNPSPDETPGESSVSLEEVGLEQPLVKDAVPTVARESYVEGENTVLASKTGAGEVSVTASSQNDAGYAEQVFGEKDSLGTKTNECLLDKREHEISSDLRVESDHLDGSVQNSITLIADLSSQKTLHPKNINDENSNSDSMLRSSYNHEDPNRDVISISDKAHFNTHVFSSSKCENTEAENVGNIEKPDSMPTEARCLNIHVSSAHTSTTIETSFDLARQVTGGIKIPAEEKPVLFTHKSLESVANDCKSFFLTEIPAQTHIVETPEAVRNSPVYTMDESHNIDCVVGVSSKNVNDEGSVQGPVSLEQRTDLAFNASDVHNVASSSQIVPERIAPGSFVDLSGTSAPKLTESTSQPDTISGTVVDGQENQTLPLNVDELKHLNNDKRPAGSTTPLADLSTPETSSVVTEKGCVLESEKVSSCEFGSGQALLPAGACELGSEMDKQACKHNEDSRDRTDNVEDCPFNDGSKEVKAQDAARQTMLQKSEETILEESVEAVVSGMVHNPDKDILSIQPDANFLDNPEAEVKKDSQIDSSNTESAENKKVGTPILHPEDDAIKIADSSCISSFTGPSAESCVVGREKPVTDPGNPSTSPAGNKPSMSAGSQVVKKNDTSSGQMSLTCDTTPLADPSMKQVGEVSQAIDSSGPMLISQVMVGSPLTSSLEKISARSSKGIPERKPRRTSKSTGKETSRKANAAKETTPTRQLQTVGKNSVINQSTPSTGQTTQLTEKPQHPHAETPVVKLFGNFSLPTSSLPDLNSSSLSSLLQRPFTDMQQVQLRAQIFVYGALIQGTAPDEAYMISAFGGSDGGKDIWEKPWRSCVERSQKSHASTPETPLQSRAGPGDPDVLPKTVLPGKIATPSVGHTSSKEIPAVNSIIPLSSPLWTLPTPRATLQSSNMQRGLATDHQPLLSSLQAHQTPTNNIVGHNAPWISPTPYRSPWLASPQTSAFEIGTRFSVFPITEAVKLTPKKETSLSHSGAKHLQKDPIVQSGTSSSVVKGTPFVEPKGVVVASSQHSAEAKRRKRKKISVSEEPGSSILNSQKQTESAVSPLVTCISASSPFIATPADLSSKAAAPTNLVFATSALSLTSTFSLEKPSSSLSSPILSGNLVSGNLETEKRSILSEDAIGKLKEAMRHAEDASTLAAAAVNQSQYVWKQVDQQKYVGLGLDNQGKLASAAIAIAAAAAVAKAAAAAANVAANAALQAKLMADEASILNSSDQGNELPKLEGSKLRGQTTPASILMGHGTSISSSSVLTAAKEAAKKRVDAATAATKQAENMDAIVKAAELAAEAVSQAGKLVSLGDPLSLNELVEAGPDFYWRHAKVSHELDPCQRDGLEKTETLALQMHTDTCTGSDDLVKSADDVSCLVSATVKKTIGQKGHMVADLAKSDVPEVKAAPISSVNSQTESERIIETASRNVIKEGSSVEVFKEGPGLRAGWYSASVLSLKDGNAYVCYTELSSVEGADRLKEWIALEGDGDMGPKIRTLRPVTAMPFEGTRKRRRAATGDRTWSVGDKVDAWVHDCWWEGVISEKNKKDETTLTVHFPVQRETLTVKSWNIRPSLVWKDGRWTECSSSGANISILHEGDTPNEKRPRLRSPVREDERKDTSSKNAGVLELGKLPGTGSLDLDVSEKTFNIGRSTRDENKLDPLRMKRTGLQKQGSRVIFGVPKPGKKRKFMEVSKHYVSEPASKTRQQNEPAKSVKQTVPQSSGSRAWRNTSKSDPREKETTLSKPRILKPASKSKERPCAATKTIVQKEDSQNISATNFDGDDAADQAAEHKGDLCGISAVIQSGETTAEQTASSLHDTSGVPSSKKVSSSLKAERINKGRSAPAVGRLAKIEEDKVLGKNYSETSESIEPRRSNRRIQPTSRLLEGLQTSMITSKIPSVSHGKGHQNQSKSSTRGK